MIPEIPETLPFHKKLARFLETEEKDLWNWFSGDEFTQSAFDEQRLYLLKNTYRLEREKHARLYALAEDVAQKLKIEAPITLYQMMDGQQRNAGLVFQPGQLQITFSGDMLTALSDTEMRFTMGHEMAHYIHQIRDKGRYQTADRLLDWICGENGAAASYGQSFRLGRLYQEIFSDRIGLFCSDDLEASISTLVRISSGLTDVSAKAYLKQVDEALAETESSGSEGYSHPETFIRARALADWANEDLLADDKLKGLVEGPPKLEGLDVIAQSELSEVTREFISAFINRPWVNTETLEAHAQGYFYDLKLNTSVSTSAESLDALRDKLTALPQDLKDYFGFVLLDFVTVDSDLEDAPLLHSMQFSKNLGISKDYDALIGKELKLTKKQVSSLHKTAEAGAA